MTTFFRILAAASLLMAGVAACTPASSPGGAGLLPAAHRTHPMDTGGGMPPPRSRN